MARSEMAWLIADVRNKVRDSDAEEFDPGVYYPGDTIRLSQRFRDLASAYATVSNPVAKIWSPGGVVKVTAATCVTSTATGMVYYDFVSSQAMSNGVWRVQHTGSVGSTVRRYSTDFEILKRQRIFTDDEIQTALDRNCVYVGLDNRELLKHNPGYTKYLSEFSDFEWVTIYDGTSSTSGEVTPTTSDLIKGIFTFSSGQGGNLFLEGESYNPYIAAAELLEELAADPNRSWNWTRGTIGHQAIDPLELARRLRSTHQNAKSVKLVRTY